MLTTNLHLPPTYNQRRGSNFSPTVKPTASYLITDTSLRPITDFRSCGCVSFVLLCMCVCVCVCVCILRSLAFLLPSCSSAICSVYICVSLCLCLFVYRYLLRLQPYSTHSALCTEFCPSSAWFL
jgi:hypothetical protein